MFYGYIFFLENFEEFDINLLETKKKNSKKNRLFFFKFRISNFSCDYIYSQASAFLAIWLRVTNGLLTTRRANWHLIKIIIWIRWFLVVIICPIEVLALIVIFDWNRSKCQIISKSVIFIKLELVISHWHVGLANF